MNKGKKKTQRKKLNCKRRSEKKCSRELKLQTPDNCIIKMGTSKEMDLSISIKQHSFLQALHSIFPLPTAKFIQNQ